jgi:hypothetical protein
MASVSLVQVLSSPLIWQLLTDVVVIIDGNEVSKLEMASKGGGLSGNTFLSASIAEEDECVVVNEVVSWLVEGGLEVSLSNGNTDSVGKTLSEGTSSDLNTGSVML